MPLDESEFLEGELPASLEGDSGPEPPEDAAARSVDASPTKHPVTPKVLPVSRASAIACARPQAVEMTAVPLKFLAFMRVPFRDLDVAQGDALLRPKRELEEAPSASHGADCVSVVEGRRWSRIGSGLPTRGIAEPFSRM